MRDDPIGRITPVHVTKYDGSYHRCIPVRYVARGNGTHRTAVERGSPITRTPDPAEDPSPFRFEWPGDIFIFEDRWFHVGRFHTDEGIRYDVDIATPATFDGAQFHFVDLDLDVRWPADSEPIVEDEDEFLDHSRAMRYPADVVTSARAAVDEVLGLIQARAFPFDRR